ncbi:hypothetical protein B0O99DRAFT_301725 [Bisporella sp. PMI_857]|nr:hypothetical protein B0O99DRAFT_301725 [Bisporella sp. PMI_857]
MSGQSLLLKYPDDVFCLILDHCEHPSLYNLVLTNKSLHERCNRQLYRTVNLASHNTGRRTEYEDDIRPDVWANTNDSWGSDGLVRRQRSFLRTITECSDEHAPLVRSFSWTLKWLDCDDDPYALSQIDRQVWTVFSRLTNVESLDLASLAMEEIDDPYVRQIPSSLSLFPRVTRLRLMGWIPHDLVGTILRSIDLSKLESLSLSMLQEEGKVPDGSPMPENINKEGWDEPWRKILRRYSASDNTVDSSLMAAGIIFPGPMWLPIVPLIGKLLSLQHLQIQIPPLEASDMDHISPDQEQYISVMADLVASIAPNLQTLAIHFLRRIRWNLSGSARNHDLSVQLFRASISKPILETFCSLFSRAGEWPLLQSVSFTGFLEKNETQEAHEHLEKILAVRAEMECSLASRGVTLEWLDESTIPGVLFLGYDSSISEESLSQFVKAYQRIELDQIDS